MSNRVLGRVTIAIPTRNREVLLRRAVDSALKQTYADLEVIVSDNCSDDGTTAYLATIHDQRLVVLRQSVNLGMVGNWNACLQQASGEFFLLLSDDDELEPEAIERLVACFLSPPEGLRPSQIALSWCPCKVQDDDRHVTYVTDGGPAAEPGIDMLTGLFDGIRGPRLCGILMRTKDVAERGYLESHGNFADFGNWTRVATRDEWVCCVSHPLARYTVHEASLTALSTAKSWQEEGEAVIRELLAALEEAGDWEKMRRIRQSRKNYITNVIATVLMQSYGRPGWTLRVLREFLRVPQYFLTPMTFRRLLLEGGKLFRKGK